MVSCSSLKRLAKVAIIPEAPATRVETIGAWAPRQWFAPRGIARFQAWALSRLCVRETFAIAAVNFISTRLAEYRANCWISDALSLGHASRATLQRRDQEGGYACVVALATGKDRANALGCLRAHERIWR